MTTLRNLIIVLAAALGATACTSRPSDRAANDVVAKQKDLDKQLTKDTDETRRVDEKRAELDRATGVFEERRDIRIIGLRTELAMIRPQGEMITSLAAQLPLTAEGRKDVDDKAQILSQRVQDATAKVSDLENATAEQWRAREDAATVAMKHLESARDDAWKAFKHAKRTDHAQS